MARPKGSGGRSSYDKYRKFLRPSRKRRTTKIYRHRSASGRFMTKRSTQPFSKSRARYKGRKTRFDK